MVSLLNIDSTSTLIMNLIKIKCECIKLVIVSSSQNYGSFLPNSSALWHWAST